MKKKYFTYFILSLLIFSCSNNSKNGIDPITNNDLDSKDIANKVDIKETTNVDTLNHDNKYSDLNYLNKIISQTKYSTDTIFLGFRMGMTKKEFIEHGLKLKEEGIDINFLKRKVFKESSKGTISITSIYENVFIYKKSIEQNVKENKYFGKGVYYIIPTFSNNSKIVEYNINYLENYDSSHIKGLNWIENEITKKTNKNNDLALWEQINVLKITYLNTFEYFRKRNNILIDVNSKFISFYDKKTLLNEIRDKLIENQKR
jgi:hypothetical protein